jgi:predicted nucleic acid-binding Zn ribbon protein
VSRPDRDPRKRLSRPRMPGEMVDPVSIGDAAALVGQELGLAEPLVFTRLVTGWSDLVGEAVAAHSRIRGVRNGVLEVVVDSPGWATEFRYLESDLVARASRLVGEGVVAGIRVTVEGPASGAREPGGDPPR